MNLDDVIHKLEFSINAYQNLLDTNVQEGFIIGKCDIGTWHANTPLNKAYSDMIEALQISKKIVEQYLLSQTDYEKIIDANVSSVLPELYADKFFPKLAEDGLIKKMFRRDVDSNESSH